MAIITTITNETCEGIQREVELKKNNNYDSNYNHYKCEHVCVCCSNLLVFQLSHVPEDNAVGSASIIKSYKDCLDCTLLSIGMAFDLVEGLHGL